MTTYILVGENTGEIEPNCGRCGIYHVGDGRTFDEIETPAGHVKMEIKNNDDLIKVRQFDHEAMRYKHKVDNPKGQNKKIVKIPV